MKPDGAREDEVGGEGQKSRLHRNGAVAFAREDRIVTVAGAALTDRDPISISPERFQDRRVIDESCFLILRSDGRGSPWGRLQEPRRRAERGRGIGSSA